MIVERFVKTVSLISLALIFQRTTSGIVGERIFTLISSSVIHPNTDYTVAVSYLNIAPEDETSVKFDSRNSFPTIDLTIRGKTFNGRTIEIRESVRVSEDQTDVVKMRIGELGNGTYTLRAESDVAQTSREAKFLETKTLKYISKQNSVFVQTDQSVYQPGSLMKFRVIILSNGELKPNVVGSFDIKLLDGRNNAVRIWSDVILNDGVYEDQWKISNAPVLGDWKISIASSESKGVQHVHKFLVAEFVYPNFIIESDVPKFSSYNQGSIPIIIKSYYSNGAPVNGEATISVYPQYKSTYLQPTFTNPPRQTVTVNGGEVNVNVDLSANLNRLIGDDARNVVVDIRIEDTEYGLIQNNTSVTTLYRHPYELVVSKSADQWNSQFPYQLNVKVMSKIDDSVIKDDLDAVVIEWTFSEEKDRPSKYAENNQKSTSDDSVTFDIPTENRLSERYIHVKLTYKEAVSVLTPIRRERGDDTDGERIQISVDDSESEFSVGRTVKFKVESTRPMTNLVYVVMGRDQMVVISESGKFESSDTYEFNVKIRPEMNPVCRIIAYTTDETSTRVIADSVRLKIVAESTSLLDLYTNTRSSFVGSDMTVNVKSQPSTFVALIAIPKGDKASRISGNVIDRKTVENEMNLDEMSVGFLTHDAQPFHEEEVLILTNARVQQSSIRGESSNTRKKMTNESGTPRERPSSAGPFAFSRIPEGLDNTPKVYLDREPPSNWLFLNTTTDGQGISSISLKTPQLQSSTWAISGVGVNSDGIIIANDNPNLVRIFQSFSVEVYHPPSLKLGETVAVDIYIKNYLDYEIDVEVILEKPQGKTLQSDETTFFETRTVSVEGQGNGLTSFLVTPTEIGVFDMLMTAKSNSLGQRRLIATLDVHHAGSVVMETKGYLLDFRNRNNIALNVSFPITKLHAVDESKRLVLSTSLDPLALPFNHFDRLLTDMPVGGCSAEQNILNIASPVLFLQLLDSITGASQSISEEKMISSLENAYQNQLKFRQTDGSFSSFGESDERGSLWITTLSVNQLQRASQRILIDPEVLETGWKWITDSQLKDGSFQETGSVDFGLFQNSKITMTAFVCIALLENKFNLGSAGNVNSMKRCIDNIANSVSSLRLDGENFDLAVSAYLLNIADHPQRDITYDLLRSSAQTSEAVPNKLTWWSLSTTTAKEKSGIYTPNSNDVLLTSFALLAYLARDDVQNAFPIFNWLTKQMSFNGGFGSTFSTYITIEAMAQFENYVGFQTRKDNINVKYTYDGQDQARQLGIANDESNTKVSQHLVSTDARNVEIESAGSGFALLQVTSQFNSLANTAFPTFNLNPVVFAPDSTKHFKLSVCVHVIEGADFESTNQAMMTINLPSGFVLESKSLLALRNYRFVRKASTDDSNSKVYVFFDKIEKREICHTISAFQKYRVLNLKSVAVEVRDLYNETRFTRTFYKFNSVKIDCNSCNDDKCFDECQSQPRFDTFGAPQKDDVISPLSSLQQENHGQSMNSVGEKTNFIVTLTIIGLALLIYNIN